MLKVSQITSGYTRVPVIKNIDFTVENGQLVGLIGLNGAGKSTTIKNIIGVLPSFSGEVLIDDLTFKSDNIAYRQQIAYIPETPILYNELTLKEHIELTGLAHNLKPTVALERAKLLLELFELADKLNWMPIYFSKGMQQKVMIILTFMIDAKVYIIDEPFLGLDPLAIKQLLTLIHEKKQSGCSILMSTHVLSTAERACDQFVFIHQGEIKNIGTLQQLRMQFNQQEATLDELYLSMVEEAKKC